MNTFYVLFAAATIAAAKSLEMKAPFNNNLPSQTKGVMVDPENPVNPDSKPGLQDKLLHTVKVIIIIAGLLPRLHFPVISF